MQPRVPVPVCSLSQETQPFVGPLASPDMVSSRPELGVLNQLRFRDPDHFRAGMIHDGLPVWESLLADFNCSVVDFLERIEDGVRIERLRGTLRHNFITPGRVPPLGLITPLFAHSFLILSVIPSLSKLPLGFSQFGARSALDLHPIWFCPLRSNLPSLVSAMMKGY